MEQNAPVDVRPDANATATTASLGQTLRVTEVSRSEIASLDRTIDVDAPARNPGRGNSRPQGVRGFLWALIVTLAGGYGVCAAYGLVLGVLVAAATAKEQAANGHLLVGSVFVIGALAPLVAVEVCRRAVLHFRPLWRGRAMLVGLTVGLAVAFVVFLGVVPTLPGD